MATLEAPKQEFTDFLVDQGLARNDEIAHWEPLTGGVSSDIWRVDLPGRSFCVKRALAQLKTASEWLAPVSRNANEWAWMLFAAQHCPDNVPRPVAHDPRAGLFAMSFLDPRDYALWKQELMLGRVNVGTARAVGQIVGRLHRMSANRPDLEKEFDTSDSFYSLRLDPYLIATAAKNPLVATQLIELADRTAGVRRALVHGDVSPKNVLVGRQGPVLLDAECAWYGDPAFDLAFCLNHLLLKCLVQPECSAMLLTSFDALAEAYFEQVDWEPRQNLEARAAGLLPALLLARIDGKSPVEYLPLDRQKSFVRSIATTLLRKAPDRLSQIATEWWSSVLTN